MPVHQLPYTPLRGPSLCCKTAGIATSSPGLCHHFKPHLASFPPSSTTSDEQWEAVSSPALPPPPAWHSQDSSSGSSLPLRSHHPDTSEWLEGTTAKHTPNAASAFLGCPCCRRSRQLAPIAKAGTAPDCCRHTGTSRTGATWGCNKGHPRHLKSHRGPVLLHMSSACTCLLACTMYAPSGRTPLLLHQHDTHAGNDGSNCHGSCRSTTAHTMAATGSPPAAHTRRRMLHVLAQKTEHCPHTHTGWLLAPSWVPGCACMGWWGTVTGTLGGLLPSFERCMTPPVLHGCTGAQHLQSPPSKQCLP